MKTIGIDIGTTTLCAVVLDLDEGIQLEKTIIPNKYIKSDKAWERIQDPDRICSCVEEMVCGYLDRYNDISAIGMTGQMHGILYTDICGKSLSPLYTWQDKRGENIRIDGMDLFSYVENKTGYNIATGWGMTTHIYNQMHGLVPAGTTGIKTIEDYVIGRLTGSESRWIHTSNAASFGLYDMKKGVFDEKALQTFRIEKDLLPKVSKNVCIAGEYKGIPVTLSVGDNQAGIAGAVQDMKDMILINVGTSAQISIAADKIMHVNKSIEVRPYMDNDYIITGSALCGGCAYKVLEEFFRSYAAALGYEAVPQYEIMEKIVAEKEMNQEKLKVSTLFMGTRDDADVRGSIHHITLDNFTPENLIYGFSEGVILELYEMYKTMMDHTNVSPSSIVILGSGIKKNKLMRKIMEHVFEMPVYMTNFDEETAVGAALISAVYTGGMKSWEEARNLIKYQKAERK